MVCCGKCSLPIGGMEDRIQCDGGCEKRYHLSCTTMNAFNLRCCEENENVLWMCNNCLFSFRQYSSNAASNAANYPEKIVERTVETTVGELQLQMEEIRNEFVDLKQYVENTRVEEDRHGMPHNSTPRSYGDEVNFPSVSNDTVANGRRLHIGSNVENASMRTARKFWIFFTRIAKHVTCDEVGTMVSRTLKLKDQPDVVKLVPQWKCSEELRYISFKVGIDWKYKKVAMLESTWPAGLIFREFVCLEPDYWQP